MKWNIVTDSSCDLLPESKLNGELQLSSVPFIISVGREDFVDDPQLDAGRMLTAMEQAREASPTSCPSPNDYLTEFEKADHSIALTISSQLSGSINSALIAREMAREQYPEKRIAVLDSRSTGPELALCVEEMEKMIRIGAGFSDVVSHAAKFLQRTKVLFALSSFNNLVRSGRMSKLAGAAAQLLNMWGIGGGSEEGKIVMEGKTRGAKKAVEMLLNKMRAKGFQGEKAAISHCENPALAQRLKERILETWQNAQVLVLPTRGLCSYYAERGGLIVSFEAAEPEPGRSLAVQGSLAFTAPRIAL